MELLIAVINQEEKLDEILSGFLELGITGATVVHSEGMGRVLSHDIPIFAGLQTLLSRSRPQNVTLFSVICGNLDDPATGIAFTLPLTRVVGLAGELGEEGL